jgi:hypothetical protein
MTSDDLDYPEPPDFKRAARKIEANKIKHPSKVIDPVLTDITRDQAMRALRALGVSDADIGKAHGLSRQRVFLRLGPRPIRKPSVTAPQLETRLDELPGFLKEWRTRHSLSMPRAARLAGVSPSSWYQWENKHHICGNAGLLLRYLVLLDENSHLIDRNNSVLGVDENA